MVAFQGKKSENQDGFVYSRPMQVQQGSRTTCTGEVGVGVWQPSFVVPAFLHGLLYEHWMKHVKADDDLMLVHRRRTPQEYNDCWNDFKTICHDWEFLQ